ncbi:hypothetical protein ACIPVK_13365 [Paeniglutamicibacter sp. MACA_103]|uniref:hypothetical protein n=1 Tax=Paeniglutamicibacter sp. MACA_103 TaxID=3377337 RepID=UPI0038935B2E
MLFGPAVDPEHLAMLQPFREMIRREDYGIVIDSDSEHRLQVCYSVGLTEKGLPELIAGMEDFTEFPQGTPSLMHHLVRTLLARGASYGEGDVFEFHGQWIRLVPESLYMAHCDVNLGLYGEKFSLLQVAACSPEPTERKHAQPICLN